MKTFSSDQEFFDSTTQAMEQVATRQRSYREELLRVLEPLAALNDREKLYEKFNIAAQGLSGGKQIGPALPLRTLCEAVFIGNPEKRLWLRSIAKFLARAPQSSFTKEERDVAAEEERRIATRALTTGDSSLGQAVAIMEPLAADIYSLLQRYSAFRTLGVIPLAIGKTRLAMVTGKADAAWLTPAQQGTTITRDASITGTSILPECSTVGALVEVSGEALADDKTTFEGALLMAIVEGLGYRIDWSCFSADGTDDGIDGGMTGIFAHAGVPIATAGNGQTTVMGLDFDDFGNVIAQVDSSAFAHPCRWWIHPDFLASLLKIHADGERLLKPPTGPNDEWRIFGWPVSWVAAAPAVEAPAALVAAFGRADAYSVALRQDFEIRSSSVSAKWANNIWLFRGIARARCLMRDASSMSILKLAAG